MLFLLVNIPDVAAFRNSFEKASFAEVGLLPIIVMLVGAEAFGI